MTFDNLQILTDSEPTSAQLRGFAHPYGPFDVAFAESTSVAMARQVVGRFVSRYAAMLVANGASQLPPLLEGWISLPTTHDAIWDDAFGQARASLTGPLGDRLALEAAAALGLRLAATGMPTRFSVQLPRPSRLLFGGCLLPIAAHIEIESDGREACIVLAGGRDASLRLRNDGSRWSPVTGETGDAGEALPLVELERKGGRVQLLSREAVFPLAMGEIEPMIPEVVTPDLSGAIGEAFAILREHAPRYSEWVGRLVRRIVPLGSPPGVMMSSSSIYRPGTITMSHNAFPLGMAEMLVHEITHEHCHLASSCGPLDDGSDTALYFSPIRGTERPISAILVAYHAVANIALFYRECRRSGYSEAEYLDVSEPEALSWLIELDGPLARTGSLTQVGRALYEPLRDQLREVS